MVGMEENLLPHRRAIESGEPHELEEERRLCYVGMTRAKDKLFMLKCFRRAFQGSYEPSLPSRFLSGEFSPPIKSIAILTFLSIKNKF